MAASIWAKLLCHGENLEFSTKGVARSRHSAFQRTASPEAFIAVTILISLLITSLALSFYKRMVKFFERRRIENSQATILRSLGIIWLANLRGRNFVEIIHRNFTFHGISST